LWLAIVGYGFHSIMSIKNVSEDVKFLSQVGLIERKDSANRMSARVNYDKILLEIAV